MASEMELETIQDEIEKINSMELLTSNETLDSIQIFDSTVEIIGFVDEIVAPRIIGNEKQYKFFKFFLNNGKGKRVQIVTWNDDIDPILHQILPNYIIHLDGVQARKPKMTNYNNGNVPYELLIRHNTVITNLGIYEPNNTSTNKPIPTELSNIMNTSGYISKFLYLYYFYVYIDIF